MQPAVEGFQLSPQQKHLWSLQQADGSLPYRAQCSILIEGNLDVQILEAALQRVFERHEILRTSFQSAPCANAPVQVVSAECMARTDKYDLSGCDRSRQEESIDRLYREMGDLAFDLSKGPLIRMSLLTLSRDRHALLINLSSFCADAATLDNLVREVSRCYSAVLAGENFSDEPLQYADASQWQNDLLESADAEEGRKYWREQNASTTERLRLPAQGSLSAQLIFAPQLLSSQLDRDLSANIVTLARKYEISPSVLLLSCWQILLWRLSGQSEFVVGVTSDARTYEGLLEAQGLFGKSLPMICHLGGDLRLSELLERTAVSVHDAVAWQEYFSWDDSSKSQNDIDSLSHFPVGFEFREDHAKYCAGAVSFVIQNRYVCSDRFALKLCCVRKQDSLSAELHYDSSLFRAEDVDRLQAEFQTLLQSVTLNPDARLDDHEIVGEMERQQLIDFNPVDTGPVSDKCIHQLFEEQVERTPDSIALVFEGKHLTYAELNSRANQVAHRLRTLGVRADVPVAICMERCLEMVVGILGILKAGGAYVPLDPEYPADRLTYMLKDVDAPILLTLQHVADRMPRHESTVLCLDTDWDSIAGHSDEKPIASAAASGRDLAYVIYTSGSTGSPKGVMVEHSGLVNAVNWIAGTLNLSPLDRCLLKTPITFDAAGRELFPILISGGTLVITEPNGHRDCSYLAETIQRERISILHCVPSLLRLIVDEPAFKDAPSMRAVMCGGEALTPQTVKRFQSRIGAKLYNVYGPTETIIDSTYWPVTESGDEFTVSIGRPIPNAQVYILDDLFRRVPIGVTGHLYIGGKGLARGYVGRPDLTGEKFVPDPFSGKSGARLYKTGDLARYRSDGNIEYLGRGDHQVKIRGFRIELGEIEATLAQHPAVLEAIVLAHEDESGDRRLLAYVTTQQETHPTASELRAFLKDRLPEHMMPAAFIVLDAFPLNANGKVDRGALPAPDAQRPELDEAFVACRTPTEELLGAIWAQVLGVQRIGIHDNFFQLGGHSLLATQVVSRIREAFKVEMPLRHLFESPTVAGLAEKIDAHGGAALQAPPIVPVPRDGELPLSFAQQRLWFIDQLEPGSVYNFPAAVRLKGPLNVAALKLSLNEIVKRHESLRTTFATVDGRPVQVIAPLLTLALPILDLRELPETEREAEVQRLATNEAQRPFDLAEGPLVRATVLRLGENDHIGLLTMHHIVTDGWSAGILIREMAILYDAFRSDRPASLPEMQVQYADFAHWQRNWLAGEVLETQLSYWTEQLLGAPPLLELPTDHPRPAIQTFHGAHQSILLTPIVGDRLKALSRQEGVTLFMTMLAAFQVLLQGHTNQDDLVIGTPIANRNRLETEGLIGFFVNTLVLRTGLSGNPTFRDLLRRVREVCLGAYAHQDLPFEKLVEELHLPRDLSRNPLFQVMFLLQNTPLQAMELPGLSLIPVEVDTATTHFDLTMHFADTAQGLLGTLTYNTDLFEAATVARMLTHFEALLRVIADAPERRLSELPLLSEAERRNILITFNDTKADKAGDTCIPQLFEAQVERTPAAIAVVLDDQQLSYEELNHRANQLANHLRLLGVKPETPVAMCLKHSVDMVIGLLAILKAGGVYVPLDPAYPKERLAFILEDAQAPVLLSHASLVPGLPHHNARVVCLDSDLETITQASAENPSCLTTPENLAYIIYTSGSTGRPKGVLVSHASIAAHCLSGQKYYALDSSDRVLQFASLSFDLSLEQIMPALVAGARLVMMSTDVWDITEFHKKVSESGLTVLNVPTSYWNELARHWAGLSELVPAIQARVFIVGGDTMLPEFVELWNRTPLRLVRLVNAYGPTETTITATVFDVASCEGSTLRRIPIGRPLANRETYILNRHGNPVPVGVSGELYIGGDCLARGYLNRADLTAENFVPNPFSGEPGARLYKTGDRARYLSDGNIEFLDRIDQQVKIRGFRVELGEIESVLRQHPVVREAVVVAREHGPGEKQLVAYIVAPRDLQPTAGELRVFLKEKLPDYLMPSVFVPIDALPLMPNGKVDRGGLPEAGRAQPGREKQFVAPRDPLEAQLISLWEEVLGVRPIGVTDNFFELGGHSLAAVRLFALIEKRLGKRVPLATVFQGATVEHLATILRQRSQAPPHSSLVAIQAEGNRRPLFLVHPAGGHVFPYVHLARHLGSDQPTYGLQAKGLEEGSQPQSRIEDMAAYYIEALRKVQPDGPYLLGGWSMGGVVAFEMAQQFHAQGQRVALLALLDTRIPAADEELADEDFEARLLVDFVRYFGLSLDPRDSLARLPKHELLERVLEHAKRAGLMPQDIEVSQAQPFIELCKADFRATRNYALRRYPGRITLLKAGLELSGVPSDPTLGWSKWADEGVDVEVVPGNHATMVYQPHVEVLAEKLRTRLDRIQAAEEFLAEKAGQAAAR